MEECCTCQLTFRLVHKLDALHSLGHDPIISSHHQNHYICDVCPSGSHGTERCMSRSVQKCDPMAIR